MIESRFPVEEEAVDPGWHVTNAGDAEWALTKIAEMRRARDTKVEAAEAMISHYEAVIRLAKDDCEQQEAFFVRELREWFETQPKRNLKASKVVDLPSGKLSLDKKAKVEFNRDNDKLAEFVRQSAPEYSKVTYGTDWANLKPHIIVKDNACILDTTGEVIDGVTATEVQPEFKIKV